MAPATDFTVNRELAGTAKNLLDDLTELDRKIPRELERGVRESYLEPSKVAGLAEKLGVEPPRIRTRKWVYVEHRVIQSVAVEAYDDAEALQIVNEGYGRYFRRGEIPAGFRMSHWADRPAGGTPRIVSEPTTKRPSLDHNLRFFLDRQGEPVALRPEPDATPAAGQSVELSLSTIAIADDRRAGGTPY